MDLWVTFIGTQPLFPRRGGAHRPRSWCAAGRACWSTVAKARSGSFCDRVWIGRPGCNPADASSRRPLSRTSGPAEDLRSPRPHRALPLIGLRAWTPCWAHFIRSSAGSHSRFPCRRSSPVPSSPRRRALGSLPNPALGAFGRVCAGRGPAPWGVRRRRRSCSGHTRPGRYSGSCNAGRPSRSTGRGVSRPGVGCGAGGPANRYYRGYGAVRGQS